MLLSIVVPCYNSERFIDKCINSLIHQTLSSDHFQLIFVNDASTDQTLSILLKYETQYPKLITVVNSTVNLKQGGARNLGLEYATGDYVGFVDSDDWVEPNMYELLHQKAQEYQCDIVGCCLYRNLPDGSQFAYPIEKDAFFRLSPEDVSAHKLLPTIGSYNVTRIIRRSILVDNNIRFPENIYYEDNFFGGILQYYVTSGYCLNSCLYHYYYNPQSTTAQTNVLHHFDRLKVELLKIAEFKKRSLFEPYHIQIEYDFLRLFYFNTMDLLFAQFNKFPPNVFSYIKKTIEDIFPQYLQNPLLQSACLQNPYYNFFLELLQKNISDDDLTLLGETYRNIFHISL